MTYNQYENEFKAKAVNAGYSLDNIEKCLAYAKPLVEKKLPVIFNTSNLSALVGYNKVYLKKAAIYTEYFYRSFEIKKKNSKQSRLIREPLPSLKEIQLWILENILYKRAVSRFAKAYIKRRNTLDNVKYHIDKKKVLRLDIKDFFPSIRIENIETIFLSFGYSSNISNLLSKLCTLDGTLPQGAPTSPYLSNLFMIDIDNKIATFCVAKQIRFTRYADDMIFSGDFDENVVINFINEIIKPMQLNTEKTLVMKQNVPQLVTGILVNKKLQISNNQRRLIRLQMHYIIKFGLDEHLLKTNNKKANFLKHIEGKINYALHVNPTDEELRKYSLHLQELQKSRPQQ